MKTFFIVGKNKRKINYLKKDIMKKGYKYSKKDPSFVISFGGDGSFLISERKYPGVPKIMLRDSKICNNCDVEDIFEALKKHKDGKYSCKEIKKLKVAVKKPLGKKELTSTSDIVIRNSLQTEALRFSLEIDGKDFGFFIGDGVVIANNHGSTGYFHSITRKKFDKGIGIAFNNSAKLMKPILLKDFAKIKIKVMRGNGIISADNNRKLIKLKKGESAIINSVNKKAKLIRFNN